MWILLSVDLLPRRTASPTVPQTTMMKEEQGFQVYFAFEEAANSKLHQIADYFQDPEAAGPISRVCLSDTQVDSVCSLLNTHRIQCLVHAAQGTNLLDERNFSWQMNGKQAKMPDMAVVCLAHGAKLAAEEALAAGAKIVVWFNLDILDGAASHFLEKVLFRFLDEVNQKRALRVQPMLQRLLSAASFASTSTDFGVEICDSSDNMLIVFREIDIDTDKITHWARSSSGVRDIKQNITQDLKMKKLQYMMLASDCDILREAKNTLSKESVFIKHADAVGHHAESRCESIALQVCQYFLHTDCIFDIVYRVCSTSHPSRHHMQDLIVRLQRTRFVLLWVHISDKRFLDHVQENLLAVITCNKQCKLLITRDRSVETEMEAYIQTNPRVFQVYSCERDVIGRQFCAVCIDIKISGIPQNEELLRTRVRLRKCCVGIKSQIEEIVGSTTVDAIIPTDDGQLVVRIQISDIMALHKVRDMVLPRACESSLSTKLATKQQTAHDTIKCDVTHFANGYDCVSLLLDKPTRVQYNILTKIFESKQGCVHLRAFAGAGKTSILL